MKELSLHILDIAQNSVSAGANNILIRLKWKAGALDICIEDDGRGMEPAFLKTAADPFSTTRKTRRVGLGLPLFKLAAEQTGGSFDISSRIGAGTNVHARFIISHIDAPPLGDMAATFVTLIQGSPGINFILRFEHAGGVFECSAAEMRAMLGDVPIDSPEVLSWTGAYIRENQGNIPTG